MNFKTLFLKILMLLNLLISGSRLSDLFIVERKRGFLRKLCFVQSWGIFLECRARYMVFGEGTNLKR